MTVNKTIKLRGLRVPEDYEKLASLFNLIEPDSTTVQSLKEEDSHIPNKSNLAIDDNGLLIGFGRTRVVVENEEEEIIGYGACFRVPWIEPGNVGCTFCVHPDFRTQGIGEMILQHIEQWARTHQASTLTSTVMDWIDESLPFAEKRGFIKDAHIFDLELDLHQFTPPKNEKLKVSGITFISFANIESDESKEKLYELFVETSKDNPGQYDRIAPFEIWQKEFFVPNFYRADLIFIALDGDEIVGVSQLLPTEDEGVVYTNYTGVKKQYRQRGIAKALKLIGINEAKSEDFRTIITDSEETNRPMQHINRTLGFKPGKGHYRIIKQLI